MGCWECVAGGGGTFGLNFLSGAGGGGGLEHDDEILEMLGELLFGKNFELNFLRTAPLEACMATWGFGYQLSVCCVTEENHGIELVCRRNFRMHCGYCMQYKDSGDPECRDLRDPECTDPARFVPVFLYRYWYSITGFWVVT